MSNETPMQDDLKGDHDGPEQTFRDTERNLRSRIAALEAKLAENAAVKERDAQIVAWLRVRGEDYCMSGQGGYATVLDLAATAIERGEV